MLIYFLTLHVSGDFCRLLISLADSLDPDQARQNVRPDLDSNCLTDGIPEKVWQMTKTKKHAKIPSMQIYPACMQRVNSPYKHAAIIIGSVSMTCFR